MEHRSVVSNFIFKEIESVKEDEPKVLVALFRRSGKVHTYQNKLAPISGSIDQTDASPIEAATRELSEETSLITPTDLKLSLRGLPFTISDSKIGREWTVHPFSWTIKPASEQRISIDWEHSTWEWIEPEHILSGSLDFECVPRLSESLRRIYVGPNSLAPPSPHVAFNSRASQILRSALDDLQTDHTNGAKVLATKAGTALNRIATECGILPDKPTSSDLDAWFHILRMASWLLITNGRPSMSAAITTCILNLLNLITPIISLPSPSPLPEVHSILRSAMTSRSSTGDRLAASFASYLTSTAQATNARQSPSPDSPIALNLLTLSSSSTLLHSLSHFLSHPPNSSPRIHLNLSILESRPLFEGLRLATSLPSTPNLSITIVPDSAVALLARKADLVLLGADRISADGDVRNKMGSYAAVAVAKAVAGDDGRELKVVVVSESEKVAKPDGDGEGHAEEEDNGPEDVVGAWRKMGVVGKEVEVSEDRKVRLEGFNDKGSRKIEVKNVYFERVPAKYVDAYVTEKGVMSTEEIRETAKKIEELEDNMFGGLARIEG